MRCVRTRDRPEAAPPALRPAPLGELTGRQREFLDAVLHHLAADGVAPTFRDLANWFGIASLNGVVCHVTPLRRKGWLLPARKSARDLRLSPAALARLRSFAPAGANVVVSLWEPAATLTPCQARRLAADLLAAADAAECDGTFP